MMTQPNFADMSKKELSEWYIENVGYDLALDDPGMSLSEYRIICSELDELHKRGLP
jgi:hypothetical protein